jgi:hypothetical protein
MSARALKGIGIGCFVACAILLFVAWERYQHNVNQVEAAKTMMGPLGGMMNQMTGGQLEPGVPEETKYALFFAVLTGVGGVVCMVMSPKMGAGNPSRGGKPPGAVG